MNNSTTAQQVFLWRLHAAFNRTVVSLGESQVPTTLQYSSGFPMQGLDFIKYALQQETRLALNAAFAILSAKNAKVGEQLLESIGQGRTGHGSATEVTNYRAWTARMEAQDEAEPRLCWIDIADVFQAVWQELGKSDDILQLSSDAERNYQVALAAVVFETIMFKRMAAVMPFSRVSSTFKDPNLATWFARWNGRLPENSPVDQYA
jgi:hypothetical protein